MLLYPKDYSQHCELHRNVCINNIIPWFCFQPLQIKSAVAVEGLKGYIYIEAYKQTHVKQVFRNDWVIVKAKPLLAAQIFVSYFRKSCDFIDNLALYRNQTLVSLHWFQAESKTQAKNRAQTSRKKKLRRILFSHSTINLCAKN